MISTVKCRKGLCLSAWLLLSSSNIAAAAAPENESGFQAMLRRLLPFDVFEPETPDIVISGVSSGQKANVRAFLSLSKEDCDAPQWRLNRLFAQADTEIDKAMRALGYYHTQIEKNLAFNKDCWQAEFKINRGPPVRIEELAISLSGEAEFDRAYNQLLAGNPIKTGNILHHGRYDSFKSSFQSLAQERGYFDARFLDSAIKVDTERNSAKIVLDFASGQRYFFGEVTIDQDILNPDFVKRFIPFEEDEFYSSRKLADTYNNLTAGGYFRTIEIRPRIDDAVDLKVPVDIALYPQKKHSYEVGVGYDTNFGPLFSLGYTNRRLNRRGHTFNAALDLSPVLSTAESRYNIPLQQPTSDFFSFGAGFKREDPDTFTSNMFKLSAQRQRIAPSGWQQIGFLDLVYESFQSADVDNSALLLIPGVRLQYTRSNSPIRPTEGYHLNFSLAGAHESVVSTLNFVQAGAGARFITGVPWSGRFIMRGDVGASLVSNFDDLPTTYRYYAGGAQSIRGYEYKELGPTNAAGQVIGGKMLTLLSLEYEQFIGDQWGVAAFIDGGNAHNDFSDIDVKIGAGIGVRWISPVGPVRIDFAVPFHESGSSFQVHFSAGSQL